VFPIEAGFCKKNESVVFHALKSSINNVITLRIEISLIWYVFRTKTRLLGSQGDYDQSLAFTLLG
jgi:hypothetical protein